MGNCLETNKINLMNIKLLEKGLNTSRNRNILFYVQHNYAHNSAFVLNKLSDV